MGRSQAFSLSGTMSLKAGFLGLGSPCLMRRSCPYIVMMGWIIDCRRSLKGPDGIMWASFFAHHMAAAASVCDCSMCSKQDDIVCCTSSVNVPGGNSRKMSSSSTFGMLPGKSSSELSVDNSLGHRNLQRITDHFQHCLGYFCHIMGLQLTHMILDEVFDIFQEVYVLLL